MRTNYFTRLYPDLQNLIYIEIYKFHARSIGNELKRILQYTENIGCYDEEGKRFNWRDLECTNLKPYYSGPIYKEIKYIGKLIKGIHCDHLGNGILPERYIFSFDENYDLIEKH